MERIEVLEEVQREIAKTLAAKLDEQTKVNQEVEELQSEQRAVDRLIRRYRSPGGKAAISNGWIAMPRSVAVLKMLQMVHKPMSPTQLTHSLAGVGRDDNPTQVGATLAYLHRTTKIKTLGRGKWVPTVPVNDDEAIDFKSSLEPVADGFVAVGQGEGGVQA